MTPVIKRALWAAVILGSLYGLTWLLAPAAVERALADLDRERLAAIAAVRYGIPPGTPAPPELTIERFTGTHVVALPLVVYHKGQSYTRNGPIADHTKISFVMWYGFAATVLWQDKEWLPGRPSRIRRLAETGY